MMTGWNQTKGRSLDGQAALAFGSEEEHDTGTKVQHLFELCEECRREKSRQLAKIQKGEKTCEKPLSVAENTA